MAILTVKDLRAKLEGLDDNLVLNFQANIANYESDDREDLNAYQEEQDEPSYTIATGTIYNIFIREGTNELVFDGKSLWVE